MKITHSILRELLLKCLALSSTVLIAQAAATMEIKPVEGIAPNAFVFDYQVFDETTQQYVSRDYYYDFSGDFGEASAAAAGTFYYDWQLKDGLYSLSESDAELDPEMYFRTTNNVRVSLTSASGTTSSSNYNLYKANHTGNEYGGAFFLNGGTVGNVHGHFFNNACTGRGGALYFEYNSTANIVSGIFAGNTSSPGSGGAVYLCYDSSLQTIEGVFAGNNAGDWGGAVQLTINCSIQTITDSTFIGNSAGNNGGAIGIYSGSSIGSIDANFYANKTINGRGGAIALDSTSTITGTITGSFNSNSAGSSGGAISLWSNSIDSIKADFIGNKANAHGGAIHSVGSGASIEGIVGNFTNNSSGEHGGAIMNDAGTYSSITGNFIGNKSGSNGGAIYNGNSGTINLVASATGILFSENRSTRDATNDDTIFNDDATINFNAGAGDIIVNGSIAAADGTAHRGNLNVTAGNVAFNSQVHNQNIVVSAGELSLGSYSNAAGASRAQLSSSSLAVNSTAVLTVDNASSLGTGNTISANGSAEVHLAAGTLSNDITLGDTSRLMVAASVTLNSQLQFSNSAMIADANGNLGQLNAVTIGASASITGESVALTNSAINFNDPGPASNIVVNEENLNIYSITTAIDISSIAGTLVLNVDIADTVSFLADYFYGGPPELAFLLNDMNGLSTSIFGDGYDYSTGVSFNFNGIIGSVTAAQDYNGGILFTVSIPEPSTATLSLLALTALLMRRRRKRA